MIQARQENVQGIGRVLIALWDTLFWVAVFGMVVTQMTKFWVFYEGHGERIAHLVLAFTIFIADFARRKITLFRQLESLVLLGAVIGTSWYFWTVRLTIITRQGIGTIPDIITMGILVYAAIRLSKTTFGWVFPIIAVLSILYAMYSQLLPGLFHGPDLGWHRVGSRFSSEMHGSLLIFVTNYLWMLVFWGLLLSVSGVNIAVMKAANYLARVLRAGPAMICLVASASAGSFTGAGPTNTLITGPITIPAMKRAGYLPTEAAAVEALASHGSAITPPIMGTVAFIMATMLGVSYVSIMIMVIPAAILWYVGVLVYLYAHFRRNSHRISSQIDVSAFADVSTWKTWRSALMGIIPVGGLVYLLVALDQTLKQATWWVVVIFAVLAMVMRVETNLKVWAEGLRRAAVIASSVTLVLLTIVIFNSSIVMTGLENRIAEIVYDLAAGNLLAATFFMIVGGVLLGAALPGIAVFFIMILTFVPVMAEFEIDRQISYFVSFYVGTLSGITPPVASGVLVASTIAQASYLGASKVTVLMGLPLYFFPFLFVFSPEVVLQSDDAIRTVYVLGVMTIGLVSMQFGMGGWFLRNITWPERAVMMMAPSIAFFGLYTHAEINEGVGNLILWSSPITFIVPAVEIIMSRKRVVSSLPSGEEVPAPQPGGAPAGGST